jgi:hypothetical protein
MCSISCTSPCLLPLLDHPAGTQQPAPAGTTQQELLPLASSYRAIVHNPIASVLTPLHWF